MILANRSARIAGGDPDHVADTVATGWDPHADRYDPAEWVADTDTRPTWWCDGCQRWTTVVMSDLRRMLGINEAEVAS